MVDYSKKTAYVSEFQDKLEKAKVVVLASCEGVNVDQMTDLRKQIRNLGDEIKVVKNTLLQRALNNLGREEFAKHMTGSVAMTFGYADPAAPVKVLFDFSEKAKKFKFKAGLLGDKMLTPADLVALSKLPSRDQLLSMLLSAMQGTIRNFVSVTQGPIRKFVYALQALKEKKEQAGTAA
jgi:large subunit ribosomal protein L10